jgi:CheY-like chemotaxis protein
MHTILLTEDNPDSVLLIQRAFRRANIPHPIQVVQDGESVILYLTGRDRYADRELYPFPSLLLLDLKIPIKSGHEVLEWLRQQPHLKRLPVVILTSSREMSDINRAYDLGANSYLVKPVGFDNLLETIKTLHQYWNSFNQAPTMLAS